MYPRAKTKEQREISCISLESRELPPSVLRVISIPSGRCSEACYSCVKIGVLLDADHNQTTVCVCGINGPLRVTEKNQQAMKPWSHESGELRNSSFDLSAGFFFFLVACTKQYHKGVSPVSDVGRSRLVLSAIDSLIFLHRSKKNNTHTNVDLVTAVCFVRRRESSERQQNYETEKKKQTNKQRMEASAGISFHSLAKIRWRSRSACPLVTPDLIHEPHRFQSALEEAE